MVISEVPRLPPEDAQPLSTVEVCDDRPDVYLRGNVHREKRALTRPLLAFALQRGEVLPDILGLLLAKENPDTNRGVS